MRAVESFPAQQGANLAPPRTSIGFTENAQLVFSGKSAPLGFRNDFQIRRANYVGRLLAIATGLNGFIVCRELLSIPELYTKFSGRVVSGIIDTVGFTRSAGEPEKGTT
jgi:hypothetical protein